MNSNTIVMLYNPHLHLYTEASEEVEEDEEEVGRGAKEECTYVCNGSSHLQYVIARKYGTSQFLCTHLCTISKTMVMLYNPHWHLYTAGRDKGVISGEYWSFSFHGDVATCMLYLIMCLQNNCTLATYKNL